MKRLLFAVVASVAFMACTQQQARFNYRGLPFTLTTQQFTDSMTARGFAVDSAASDSGRTLVYAKAGEHYRVLMAYEQDAMKVVQETYALSTNDSTRRLWQQLRDGLEQELGAWPDCPILKDDHKVANFDATDGIVSVILENTYKPTLTVRYTPKRKE